MDKSCAIVEEYYYFTPFHIVEWTQLVTSLVSIILVVYTSIVYLCKSWFEEVFKETLYFLYFVILLHSILTAVLNGAFIIMQRLVSVPCEAQFDRRWCILRLLIAGIFPSFVGIHASITVQRIITTFSGNKTLHHLCARLALLVTAAYCVIFTIVAYHSYPLQGRTPFCSGYHSESESIILINTTLLMVADVLNVIVDGFLLVYNKRKMHSMDKALPLSVKFRYRQTFYSIQQFVPVAVCHAICFSVQFVTFHISFSIKTTEAKFTTFAAFCYLVPWYCVICPAMILCLMRRGRLQRNCHQKSVVAFEDTTEKYFSALRGQWNQVPREKKSRVNEVSNDKEESTTV